MKNRSDDIAGRLDNVPTLDGRPTAVSDLGIEAGASTGAVGLIARLWRCYRNLNLVLAGMYTGQKCHGRPHTHHRYKEKTAQQESKS